MSDNGMPESIGAVMAEMMDGSTMGATALIEAMALLVTVESIDESMHRFNGDGAKLFETMGITTTAAMSVITNRVKRNLKVLDEALADGGELAEAAAGKTPEQRRLAENMSSYAEGFIVGLRYMKADMQAQAELAAEEMKAKHGDAPTDEVHRNPDGSTFMRGPSVDAAINDAFAPKPSVEIEDDGSYHLSVPAEQQVDIIDLANVGDLGGSVWPGTEDGK